MIAQFPGEDRWDAIVNHFSLDIVEEDDFYTFIQSKGHSENDSDEIIESLYEEFQNQ